MTSPSSPTRELRLDPFLEGARGVARRAARPRTGATPRRRGRRRRGRARDRARGRTHRRPPSRRSAGVVARPEGGTGSGRHRAPMARPEGRSPPGSPRAARLRAPCAGARRSSGARSERSRGLLAPDLVDQHVGRDEMVGAEEQVGEDRSLLRAPERDRAAAVLDDLDRSQHPEFHRATVALGRGDGNAGFGRRACGSRRERRAGR